MAGTGSEVDPQVLEDLRTAEQVGSLFGVVGIRAEFWETFTLLKTNREVLQSEIVRLTIARGSGEKIGPDPVVQQSLARIREELGPIARRLRELLNTMPVPLDGMRTDLAIVFLMSSAKARESVARWVADPTASAKEAALRIKIMTRLVDAYRTALLEARKSDVPSDTTKVSRIAPITPPSPPVAPAAASLRTSEDKPTSVKPATTSIKPEFVEDIRRLEKCRTLIEGLEPSLGWELFCMILNAREETRRKILELEQLQTRGKPGEFAGAAYGFRQELQKVRTLHGDLVKNVRGYLEKIYGGQSTAPDWSARAEDLALAFLVASSTGRHRARQWLDDPELCRGEATASMNGLRTRARSYLDAAKNLPVGVIP